MLGPVPPKSRPVVSRSNAKGTVSSGIVNSDVPNPVNEAVRGVSRARSAIEEGGHARLLEVAKLTPQEIDSAASDGMTEEALRNVAAMTLATSSDLKGPRRFVRSGLGRLANNLDWSAAQRFSGLLATVKLCGISLPDPPSRQEPPSLVPPSPRAGLGSPRGREDDEYGSDSESDEQTKSSASSNSTWMGEERDRAWDIPINIRAVVPKNLFLSSTESMQAAQSLSLAETESALRIRDDASLRRMLQTVKSARTFTPVGRRDFEGLIGRLKNTSAIKSSGRRRFWLCSGTTSWRTS